jgi:hypothetical protein
MTAADKLFKATITKYSPAVRLKLSEIRQLVLRTARETKGVGEVLEALRWGQFSFLTAETESGSTIRIDGRREGDMLAVYFHCQSGLISHFKELYPKCFTFEGERALLFDARNNLPTAELKHCISLALTHHLRKKSLVKREK